jgi:hypothetical protein
MSKAKLWNYGVVAAALVVIVASHSRASAPQGIAQVKSSHGATADVQECCAVVVAKGGGGGPPAISAPTGINNPQGMTREPKVIPNRGTIRVPHREGPTTNTSGSSSRDKRKETTSKSTKVDQACVQAAKDACNARCRTGHTTDVIGNVVTINAVQRCHDACNSMSPEGLSQCKK